MTSDCVHDKSPGLHVFKYTRTHIGVSCYVLFSIVFSLSFYVQEETLLHLQMVYTLFILQEMFNSEFLSSMFIVMV